MANCWAQALGGCGKGQSREHPISKALLGSEMVTISGLPWCAEPKTVSIASLGTKILCGKHNSDLGDLDNVGSSALNELKRFHEIRTIRRAGRQRQVQTQRYRIQGRQLERWMLKAVIGTAYERELPNVESWAPPKEWVEITFGLRPFPDGAGLYASVPELARRRAPRDRLELMLLTKDGKGIDGADFDLDGWRLTLSLVPVRGRDADYRPRFLRDRSGLTTWQVVAFDW